MNSRNGCPTALEAGSGASSDNRLPGSPHGRQERRLISLVTLIRAQIPLMGAPPSWPSLQRPHLPTSLCWGAGFQHTSLGGTQTFSPSLPVMSLALTLREVKSHGPPELRGGRCDSPVGRPTGSRQPVSSQARAGSPVRRRACGQIGAGKTEREEGGATPVQKLLEGAAGRRKTGRPEKKARWPLRPAIPQLLFLSP